MNNLQDFISTFKNGFQRPNRFLCQIIVQPRMIANIIADSAGGDSSIIGIVQRALDTETSVLSVPQVVKWLAQGFVCSQARLPDRGFGMVDQYMYGITEHFPVSTEYSSFDATFLMPYATNIDNDNALPRFFNYWQNQIQNNLRGPKSGFDFRFPSEYYGSILLTTYDRKNRGTLTYKFENVYPATVNSVPLSWGENDKFAELPVSFNFSYWTVASVAESAALSILERIIT